MENGQRNRYAPPVARVGDEPAATGTSGSLEDAVAGNYEFTIGGVMTEAWALVPGFKGSFWGALALVYLVFFAFGVVFALATGSGGDPPNIWLQQILNGLLGIIMSPLFVGLMSLGVRRACGLPVSFSMAFDYIRKAPVLIAAGLLVTLLTYVGLFLLILPGIYLAIAYGMTLPLLAFNELGIWQSMETSRRTITHRWFGLFGLYLLMSLLVALSALPLLIPLVWTVPWSMLVFGVVYRRMFGVPPSLAGA